MKCGFDLSKYQISELLNAANLDMVVHDNTQSDDAKGVIAVFMVKVAVRLLNILLLSRGWEGRSICTGTCYSSKTH